MPKLARKTVIGIKQETTQGTPVAVTATDFILAEDVDIKPIFSMNERNYKTSSIDPLTNIPGMRWYEISFKTEIKGSGTAGTGYLPLDAALQGCGFTSVALPGTSVTYAPTSDAASANYYGPGKSVSIEIYKDGIKHIAAGCLGSVKLSGEAGKIGMLEFTFFGLYAEPTDAAPGTQTYNTVIPPILVSSTLTIQTFAAIANKIDWDVNNTVSKRPDTRAATGLLGFIITDRNPQGSVDPELDTVANHNFWNRLSTPTEGSMVFKFGTVAGNIITFTQPKTQYLPFSYGDRENLATIDLPVRFNRNTGDDWTSVVFT